MKMYPGRRRADPEHLRYLGDLITGKTMQGNNVALAALQSGDAMASFAVAIRRIESIGTISADWRSWPRVGIVM